MARHAFKKGDRVAILNNTLGGRCFVEGFAVVKKLLDTDDYYTVQFEPKDRQEEGDTYDRFAFKQHQKHPEAFAHELNKRLGLVCTVCGVNPVNAEEGFDTCEDCLAKV